MTDFADWRAICDTKARYCRCMDTKDWAGYADCFVEDLVLDTRPAGGYVVEGRDAAVKLVRSSIETAKTAHQVHNPEMTIDGDTADVIWPMQDRVVYGAERAAKIGTSGHTGFGHYTERYVRCPDGRWRIAHTTLSRLHVDVYPLAGGPA